MIVVSSGGVTHKHPEPVKVGDPIIDLRRLATLALELSSR
jgi:hypothetical protein